MREKESWQIKHNYRMPDGRVVRCIYEKAIKKLRSGKYGEGMFEEEEVDGSARGEK